MVRSGYATAGRSTSAVEAYDTMEVVWHDHKAVQLHFGTNPSGAQPLLTHYFSSRGKLDFPAHYLSKEVGPLPSADGYEVCSSPGIVVVLKPRGAATSAHEPILHPPVFACGFLAVGSFSCVGVRLGALGAGRTTVRPYTHAGASRFRAHHGAPLHPHAGAPRCAPTRRLPHLRGRTGAPLHGGFHSYAGAPRCAPTRRLPYLRGRTTVRPYTAASIPTRAHHGAPLRITIRIWRSPSSIP